MTASNAKGKPVIGLEIGTTKVCVAVGQPKDDGTISILGVVETPSTGVSEGEIIDYDAAVATVRKAIAAAEEQTHVAIRGIHLAVTGEHIRSFNTHATVLLPDGRPEINQEDLRQLEANARTVSLPPHHAFLHSIANRYVVDGQERISNPIGMRCRRLEAEFHIIYGVIARIQKSIRCVKDLGLDLEDVVFAPLAASQTVLSDAQKQSDAVVIDIGGGTTDYVLYADGVIKHSGALPFGGHNITRAIALRLQISDEQAETLKIKRPSGEGRNALKNGSSRAANGTANGADEKLKAIIDSRLNHMFGVLERLVTQVPEYLLIVGGSCLLRSCSRLATAAFGVRAQVLHPKSGQAFISPAEAPEFATAIGLIHYATRQR